MGHAQLPIAIANHLFASRQVLSNLKQTVDAGWSDVTLIRLFIILSTLCSQELSCSK